MTFINKVTLTLVDLFGLEYEDSSISFKINNPYEIKIFNVFSKKHAPLNYNNTSNNNWLEVFILEINKSINNKFPQNKEKINYIHDLVEPLIEANSLYKNYKVSRIEIHSSHDFKYTIDDGVEELEKHISIERMIINDKIYSLPIATFSPIMDYEIKDYN